MKSFLHINQIKNFFLETLFPVRCTGCQLKNEILCNNCIKIFDLNQEIIGEDIRAVFNYKNIIIKKIIWELKYHHKRYLGEKLGNLLYEFLIEDISDIKINVSGRSIFVIPIPISNNKIKSRGYNQTLAIANGFCKSEKSGTLELKDKIVIKKYDTIPQAKITNKKRRLENIKNVFEIKNKEIIKGRTIILIDDVVTTGGTLREVMKILKKAGAKKIYGYTVAH